MRPLLVIAALIFGTACAGASAGTATDTSITTVSTLYGRPPTTTTYPPPTWQRPERSRFNRCLDKLTMEICITEEQLHD